MRKALTNPCPSEDQIATLVAALRGRPGWGRLDFCTTARLLLRHLRSGAGLNCTLDGLL